MNACILTFSVEYSGPKVSKVARDDGEKGRQARHHTGWSQQDEGTLVIVS
jgi:hypothetical protein